jgi:hypothetical protein
MEGKYLITTDNWFYAPDGLQYRAAWGNVSIIEDVFLGLKTNRNSTNWYAKIGSDKNYCIVAGCQIHYAVKCDLKPNINDVEDYSTDAEKGKQDYTRRTNIYIAE